MEHISKLMLPLALCLFACARQGAPTGGSKDTTPPRIDTLGSTPNFATRVDPRRFELKFDEWITLSDAAAQIIVSPPLEKRPEVTLRGKRVLVRFDENEKFRENTTYTINFGSAVKDLHEGNPAKDLRFVFSTGDFIDSLSIRGRTLDAFSAEPIENVSVMLYDNFADSVVRTDRPYYFAKAEKSGVYEISNLKAGNFKLLAVEDLDQNLRWDGENERIGFLDSTLTIRDSMKGLLVVQLFKNQPEFRIIEKNTNTFGVVRLKFNASTDSVRVQAAPIVGLKTLFEKTQDSIMMWYDLEADNAWELYVNYDTVPVKALSREDFLTKHQLNFAEDVPRSAGNRKAQQTPKVTAPPAKTMQQNPAKPTVFGFNYPIVSLDTAKWQLVCDSLRVYEFAVFPDSVAPRNCLFQHQWQPGKSYKLELLPGAVTDFWGQTNSDTLRRMLNILTEKQLGGLNLSISNLQEGQVYIVQLLAGNRIVETQVFKAAVKDKKLIFSNLNVTTYSVRLIEDRNNNGRWDTGDYWAHRQPEPIISKKLEALRANWEIEASISLNPDGEARKRKK